MHDMAPEAGICSFADVFAHVCLTMLADPCFLCTREWAAGPSVTASWASHRLPASTTRVPATVFFQGSSSERPTFQKAGGLPVVRGQWCWQCISSSSLEFPSSSRLEDICGQMSRKRWENLFFFFLIGYWDHKMKCVKRPMAWETIIQMGWRILGRGKKISWDDVIAVLGLI